MGKVTRRVRLLSVCVAAGVVTLLPSLSDAAPWHNGTLAGAFPVAAGGQSTAALLDALEAGVARQNAPADEATAWDADQRRDAVDEMVDALAAQGPKAIPQIEERLSREDMELRLALLRAVSYMEGEEGPRFLLGKVCSDEAEELRRLSLIALEGTPIPFPLTQAQIQVLSERLETESPAVAGSVALLLSQCATTPAEQVAPPVVRRFARQVLPSMHSPPAPSFEGAYMSPGVLQLNAFLRAFAQFGGKATPYLWAKLDQTKDEEVRKWLVMALGMAGDESVAEDVRAIVVQDPDRYVRSEAVRAYARSAGQEAVPFLTELLDDPTETEFGPQGKPRPDLGLSPMRLIASVAAGELARLEEAGPAPAGAPGPADASD